MQKVFLLRHAQTNCNLHCITQAKDPALTQYGLDYTKKSMQHILYELDADNILLLCSDMIRAKQTAEMVIAELSKQSHVGIRYDANLREVDFGDFCNMPEDFTFNGMSMQNFRDLTVKYYEYKAAGIEQYFEYPHGENSWQIQNRCKNVINMVNHELAMGIPMIVLVAHNRFFRHLLIELGVTTPDNMFDHKIPHVCPVEVPVEKFLSFA